MRKASHLPNITLVLVLATFIPISFVQSQENPRSLVKDANGRIYEFYEGLVAKGWHYDGRDLVGNEFEKMWMEEQAIRAVPYAARNACDPSRFKEDTVGSSGFAFEDNASLPLRYRVCSVGWAGRDAWRAIGQTLRTIGSLAWKRTNTTPNDIPKVHNAIYTLVEIAQCVVMPDHDDGLFVFRELLHDDHVFRSLANADLFAVELDDLKAHTGAITLDDGSQCHFQVEVGRIEIWTDANTPKCRDTVLQSLSCDHFHLYRPVDFPYLWGENVTIYDGLFENIQKKFIERGFDLISH